MVSLHFFDFFYKAREVLLAAKSLHHKTKCHVTGDQFFAKVRFS
jgi:hypothetical protein